MELGILTAILVVNIANLLMLLYLSKRNNSALL